MEVATLDGTAHFRKSRDEPPLKVAGYDYSGSRKTFAPNLSDEIESTEEKNVV